MSEINYVDDLIDNLSDNGITQELRDLLYDDTQLLSDLNVSNDRQRNLVFYLDNFCDDLCEEFGYNIKDKKPVIIKSFNYLKKLDDVDLTKIRAAVLKSLRELNRKVAYPNNTGVNEINMKPERDVNQWVRTLGEVYRAMRGGEDRNDALKKITEGWDPMEIRDFEAWTRYYEKGDHEKYNIKVAEEIDPDHMRDSFVEEKETAIVKHKSPDELKKALLSRLNSAERLLYNFVHVWPDDVYKRLHEGLSDLKREITMMRTASSMIDRIIRTASVWEYNGFLEGANELRKIAQPPNDITSEIEKALTGREFEKDMPENKPEEMPGEIPGEETMPPPPIPEEMPPEGEIEEPTAPPAGVEESLPPEAPLPGPEKEGVPNNPYSDATVQDVLEVLEPLSQRLREREFIRDLSKADMMLDALNIASHFPELGEAQAKALELNIYVGTRMEKVISKLKGGLKEEEGGGGEKSVPDIEMGELEQKPEEIAFEVTEEMPTK